MKCKLSDICICPKGKIEVANLDEATYISTENMLPNRGGVVPASGLPTIESTQAFADGDVLVSNIRPYFKKIWQATFSGGCSNDVLVFRVKNGIDKDFLYYVLSDDQYFNYATATSKGTKMPRGDKVAIMQYIVPNVSHEEQCKIASILRAIDQKIQLNKEINHNLQQQFQALFDSWFKRFEPFSQPKYESELGLIPEGWSVKDIYSISSIIYGAPFSSKLFNDEHKGSPIVRIRDLKTQNTSTYTTEIHPKGYLIQNGDIIVGMDGEFRPYIWGSGEAWLNQRVCVFENKRPKGKVFLFCSIKPLLNLIEQTEVATTVIHIGKQDFDAFRIVMPPIEILNAFDDITAPMYNRIVNNIMENHRLSALRDSLLPRLMSGEINVSEVEL